MRAPALIFWLKYFFNNALFAFQLLLRGEWRRVSQSLYARIYNKAQWVRFLFAAPVLRRRFRPAREGKIEVITDHPVAFTSPDHLAPYGTMYNNTTNRGFVLLLNNIVRRQRRPIEAPAFMDLGCAGGQLVKDFSDVRWTAVGLEGSDYSLKHRRANWRTFFIASTASYSSIQDGIELHQTRMTNAEWRKFIAARYPDLQLVDLGLQTHQYVRYDFGEPSFLLYAKNLRVESAI